MMYKSQLSNNSETHAFIDILILSSLILPAGEIKYVTLDLPKTRMKEFLHR